jgi:hypothetical protein
MIASGEIATSEPDGLALRTAKHFAHKVPVETVDGVTRIETRFGRIELEPTSGALAVRLDGDDLEKLRDVAASHLERFSRDESFTIVWH